MMADLREEYLATVVARGGSRENGRWNGGLRASRFAQIPQFPFLMCWVRD